MCELVMEAVRRGNIQVTSDLRRVLQLPEDQPLPTDSTKLAGCVVVIYAHTCPHTHAHTHMHTHL